jgi:hypothetical protein
MVAGEEPCERRREYEGALDLTMLAHKLFDELQTIGKTWAVKLPVQRQRWQRPAREVRKVNSDGAFTTSAGARRCSYLMDAFHTLEHSARYARPIVLTIKSTNRIMLMNQPFLSKGR